MTGLETLLVVLAIYVAFEAVAIPLGHVIGKRAGGLRVTLLTAATIVLVVGLLTWVTGR